MDECIDSLSDGLIFSTIHKNRGYWQVKIEGTDDDKTALTSHDGLYRFSWKLFGLRNALQTFQQTMEVILSPAK